MAAALHAAPWMSNAGFDEEAALRLALARSVGAGPVPQLSAQEWLAAFAAAHGQPPTTATGLHNFVKNRRGNMTYQVAREVVAASTGMAPQRSGVVVPQSPRRPLRAAVNSATVAAARDDSQWYRRVHGPADSTEVCAICLALDGDDWVEVRCGGMHRFHQSCIGDWISRTVTPKCPTCRQAFLPTGVFQSVPAPTTADALYSGRRD